MDMESEILELKVVDMDTDYQPGRIRLRDLLLLNDTLDDYERVQVQYFANEKSLKERLNLYFITNQRSSLRIRFFNVIIKLLSCLLYVIRIHLGEGPENAACYGCSASNESLQLSAQIHIKSETEYLSAPVMHYQALVWVDRDFYLWLIQVIVASISLAECLLLMYINYKGNFFQLLCTLTFMLEMVTSVPFIVTIFHTNLRNLYIPVFFNCWLAKAALENMLNDLHRHFQRSQSALSQQMIIMLSTLLCLIFTSTCGIQHLQRAGRVHFTFFQSLYFVIVTFSTVGYGEFYPDIWPSQLYVISMICVAFVVIPSQLEQLAYTWMQRQKSGGCYSRHRARLEKHVVVTTTCLQADVFMDFLNEFYAHPKLQEYFVVLLTPSELDTTMRLILQNPLWSSRVIYVQGTVLKDTDLLRARMSEAFAVFILANRNFALKDGTIDKNAADEHTILRSWAVKDHAPQCPQYVQLFRPENNLHIKHAEYFICEDEFKYALLANNCLCPGISTLLTLLLHTSRGAEGQHSSEEWHQIYGRHSGNEIYHIQLGKSKFFGEYEGKPFTYASFHAHRKYAVSLVGVQRLEPGSTILLNPGKSHMLKATDICYYMSITKEEQSAFVKDNGEGKYNLANLKIASTVTSLASVNRYLGGGRSIPKVSVQDVCGDQVQNNGGTVAFEVNRNASNKSGSPAKKTKRFGRRKKSSSDSRYLKQSTEDPNHLLPSGSIPHNVGRKPSIDDNVKCETASDIAPVSDSPVPEAFDASDESDVSDADIDECGSEDEQECIDGTCEHDYIKGFPPFSPYVGSSATLCHLVHHKTKPCCLNLSKACSHSQARYAKDYGWKTPAIILSSDVASYGIYNFIIPLRAHYRPRHRLYPIVLLIEEEPDGAFLDAIAWFPLVYFMKGSISKLDDLLRAGITMADHVVVANKESSNSAYDNYMADCNTIVAVQTMYRLFPTVHLITELSHSSNMRFMQFNAKDVYALQQSKIEKKERERNSHIYYMFRLPFASGRVFSASMLDTLLYQAFVKKYLIQFVRLLIGIDQAAGSGYLASLKITEPDMWIRTYGRLYQKLCATESIIPIGIYRTQPMDSVTLSTQTSFRVSTDGSRQENPTLTSERHDITNLVKCRMEALGLPLEDYSYHSGKRFSIEYVILNPSFDLKLQPGDIVYVIKPASPSAQAVPVPASRYRHNQSPHPARKRSWRRESRKLNIKEKEELLNRIDRRESKPLKNRENTLPVDLDEHAVFSDRKTSLQSFNTRLLSSDCLSSASPSDQSTPAVLITTPSPVNEKKNFVNGSANSLFYVETEMS